MLMWLAFNLNICKFGYAWKLSACQQIYSSQNKFTKWKCGVLLLLCVLCFRNNVRFGAGRLKILTKEKWDERRDMIKCFFNGQFSMKNFNSSKSVKLLPDILPKNMHSIDEKRRPFFHFVNKTVSFQNSASKSIWRKLYWTFWQHTKPNGFFLRIIIYCGLWHNA